METAPAPDAPSPALSIVVPLYDEEENVLPLAQKVLHILGSHPGGMELLLVDDCSTDATWERIRGLCARDPRVRGLRHAVNRGQSAALWTGFRACRGAIIATLDGDLQNDPADLPSMIAALDSCDMICGVRTQRADNWVRRVSSIIARWTRQTALRSEFRDTGCNLRAFKKPVLDTLPAFNGIHRFMPILAQNGGATVREVPVRHHPRAAGRSKYGVWNRLWRGLRDLLMISLYIRRQLKVMLPAGSIIEASC